MKDKGGGEGIPLVFFSQNVDQWCLFVVLVVSLRLIQTKQTKSRPLVFQRLVTLIVDNVNFVEYDNRN